MRFLDREQHPAPKCLARYKPGQDWMNLSRDRPDDYLDLVAALADLQGERCAYCESPLRAERRNPHVDHFQQRRRAPQLTFVWSNLFWSCTNHYCCAKHKDDPATQYSDALLLKPDVEDPRKFLVFLEDGWIDPRPNLKAEDRRRAELTIKVFNLNAEGLRARRRDYLRIAKQAVEEALDLLSPEEAASYLELERTQYEAMPFSSAMLEILGFAP